MISTTQNEGSPKQLGPYAFDARIKLAEVVVILSFIYSAEAFHEYKTEELKEMNKRNTKYLLEY